MHSIDIIVVRIQGDTVGMSKPCSHCVAYLKSLHMGKIYYSYYDGQIIVEKIKRITSDHVSVKYRASKR